MTSLSKIEEVFPGTVRQFIQCEHDPDVMPIIPSGAKETVCVKCDGCDKTNILFVFEESTGFNFSCKCGVCYNYGVTRVELEILKTYDKEPARRVRKVIISPTGKRKYRVMEAVISK